MCQTLALEINGHDRGSDPTTSPTMGPKSSLNSLSNCLASSILGDTLSNFNLHHTFMWESNVKSNFIGLWSDIGAQILYTDVKHLFDKIKVYVTWEDNSLDLELSGFPCQCHICTNKLHSMFLCKAKKETIEYVHLPELSEGNCSTS